MLTPRGIEVGFLIVMSDLHHPFLLMEYLSAQSGGGVTDVGRDLTAQQSSRASDAHANQGQQKSILDSTDSILFHPQSFDRLQSLHFFPFWFSIFCLSAPFSDEFFNGKVGAKYDKISYKKYCVIFQSDRSRMG